MALPEKEMALAKASCAYSSNEILKLSLRDVCSDQLIDKGYERLDDELSFLKLFPRVIALRVTKEDGLGHNLTSSLKALGIWLEFKLIVVLAFLFFHNVL